jgi:maleylacetate reductase
VDDQFVYDALPGRVVFGDGVASTALAAEVDRFGAGRLLVVCSDRDRQLADRLTAPFATAVVGSFSQVREHVPVEIAQAARQAARQAAADGVLVIGGGSAVGTAKAIALTDGLPVLAVPTTYAGSELTPVWGLTEAGRKTTGVDRAVLPRVVLYDPQLTLTLPVGLSVASGLNAMAHSVEAFWAPGRNPVTALAAQESIRELARGLPGVVADPLDPVARSGTLYGAYLAGAAFAVAGAGLHHKICHVLGGSFDLPHARTHAVVLPHVLAFNAPAAPEAAARISAALGADRTDRTDQTSRASRASQTSRTSQTGQVRSVDPDPCRALRRLGRSLGAPGSLRELGLAEDALDRATDLVLPGVPADNPRPVDRDQLRALLGAAWAGRF